MVLTLGVVLAGRALEARAEARTADALGGLAVPTAAMVASGRGAAAGVLVTGDEALERARRVDTVVLHKTGTGTEGRPALADVVALAPADEARVLALERASEHPLAAAVVAGAAALGAAASFPETFTTFPGPGAAGTIDGVPVLVRNAAPLAEWAVDAAPLAADAERLAGEGKTPVLPRPTRRARRRRPRAPEPGARSLAIAVSSVSAVTNSLRLRRARLA